MKIFGRGSFGAVGGFSLDPQKVSIDSNLDLLFFIIFFFPNVFFASTDGGSPDASVRSNHMWNEFDSRCVEIKDRKGNVFLR